MTKKLKILFITYTHSNGGGAEAVLTTLVNNLPKTWQIDILEVVSFDVKKEPINKNINLLPPLTKHNDRTKFDKFFNIILLRKPELIKEIRQLEAYDVVIGWMYLHATFLVPTFAEAKKIAWFHGMLDNLIYLNYSPLNVDYYEKKMYFHLQQKTLEDVDNVIILSNMCLKSLNRVFPKSAKKAKIIYNGTDIEKINDCSKENIFEYDGLFKKKEPFLIAIGRLDTNKNFSLALESIKILKERKILCNLIILGSEVRSDIDLHKLATTLGIGERIFFLGYKQNPLPFIRRSKLLLITSFSEGFPTVATEAMALGIPFVTTQVSGASEELANNNSCGLVSDWNAKEYADNIEKLLKDDALYKRMSKNCKEHIKNYSVEKYVSSFAKMLEDIPEKKAKKQNINYFLSTLLFIFYSSFYLSINNRYNRDILKLRYLNIIYKPSLLNLCKVIYRLFVYVISIMSFPFLLIYVSFLISKARLRKEI